MKSRYQSLRLETLFWNVLVLRKLVRSQFRLEPKTESLISVSGLTVLFYMLICNDKTSLNLVQPIR